MGMFFFILQIDNDTDYQPGCNINKNYTSHRAFQPDLLLQPSAQTGTLHGNMLFYFAGFLLTFLLDWQYLRKK